MADDLSFGDEYPHALDPSLKDSMDILEGDKKAKDKGGSGGGSGGSGSGGSGTGDGGDDPLHRLNHNFAILVDHLVYTKKKWYANIPKYLWLVGITLSLMKAGPEVYNRITDAQEKREKAEIKAAVGDRMYYDEGNEKSALKFYKEALEINDSKIDYAYKKSFVENMITIKRLLNLSRDFNIKDIDEAKMSLAKGIELNMLSPGKSDAYVLQGQAYIALGRIDDIEYDKAKDALTKAIQLDPKNDFALMRLGVVYQEMAEREEDPAKKAMATNNALDFYKLSLYTNNNKVIDKLKNVLGGSKYDALIKKSFEKDLSIDRADALDNIKDKINYLITKQLKASIKDKQELEEKVEEENLKIKASFKKLEETKDGDIFDSLKNIHSISQDALAQYFVGNLKISNYKDFYIYLHELGIDLDLSQTMDQVKYLLAANKKSKWANLWMGVTYKFLNNWDKAKTEFQKSLYKDPQFELGYVNFGQVYLSKQYKNIPKAIKYFVKAAKINPSFSQAYFGLGWAYGDENKYSRSLGFFKKAVELNPEYLEALEFKGLIHKELHQYKEAVKNYSKALTLALQPSKRKAELYMRRGQVYQLLGDHEKAIDDIDASLELKPNNPRAYYNKGNLFLEIEEYSKAIANYRKALKLYPKYGGAYSQIAVAYDRLGQSDKAEYYYSKAILFAGRHPYRSYTARGNYYTKQKQYSKAMKDYNTALKMNPRYYPAYNKRGILYKLMNEPSLALKDFNKVVDIKPGKVEGYLGRASIYLSQKNVEKAISNYTKALNVKPKNIKILNMRAEAYQQAGKKDLANKDLAKIKRIKEKSRS